MVLRNSLLLLLLIACRGDRLVQVTKCGHPCTTQSSQKGVCREGVWQCEGDESTAICVGEVLPEPETCDGLDNDCNGDVDDFVPPKCQTSCGEFLQTCKDGQLKCYARQPKDEVCNGMDDDCDGTVDNPELLPLEFCYPGNNTDLDAPYGDCHPGKLKCEYGVKVCRQFKSPTPEQCDGIDNNCNSTIDEGAPDCAVVADLRVVLSWNIVNDVDLHLRNPVVGIDSHNPAAWGPTLNNQGDCFYGNRTPNWDNQASIQDDPNLDRDIIHGIGPETIRIPKPSTTHPYTIGVHMYNYAAAPSIVDAKVEIYCANVLVSTMYHSFNQPQQHWVVGDITFDNNAQCVFNADGYVFTR